MAGARLPAPETIDFIELSMSGIELSFSQCNQNECPRDPAMQSHKGCELSLSKAFVLAMPKEKHPNRCHLQPDSKPIYPVHTPVFDLDNAVYIK